MNNEHLLQKNSNDRTVGHYATHELLGVPENVVKKPYSASAHAEAVIASVTPAKHSWFVHSKPLDFSLHDGTPTEEDFDSLDAYLENLEDEGWSIASVTPFVFDEQEMVTIVAKKPRPQKS
jgi:hypothetical protein